MIDIGLHLLGRSNQVILACGSLRSQVLLKHANTCKTCYSYANNPPLAFLLPVFLDVEAVASGGVLHGVQVSNLLHAGFPCVCD